MEYLKKEDALKLFEEMLVKDCGRLKEIIIAFLETGRPSVVYPLTPYYKSYLELEDIILDAFEELSSTGQKNFNKCIVEMAGDEKFLKNLSVSNVMYQLVWALGIDEAVYKLIETDTRLDKIDSYFLLVRVKDKENKKYYEFLKKYLIDIDKNFSLSISLLKKLIVLEDDIEEVIKYFKKVSNAINKFKSHYHIKDNDKKFIELKEIIINKFGDNPQIKKALKENGLPYLI